MLVHIIDDDPAVGRTVARSARRAGWDTALYGSAQEFLSELDALETGCIISDVSMPGMTGLELIQILHAKHPQWPVIIMTAFGELDGAIQAFRGGAIHFLQKPFLQSDLVVALEEAKLVGQRRRQEVQRQQQSSVLQKLTAREREVLGALAAGQQSKNIAWQLGISTRTVEMHRSNILTKLGARNTSQAVGLFQLLASA